MAHILVGYYDRPWQDPLQKDFIGNFQDESTARTFLEEKGYKEGAGWRHPKVPVYCIGIVQLLPPENFHQVQERLAKEGLTRG